MSYSDFSPSVFHPYYIIRNGLNKKIIQYKDVMRGRLLDFGCGSKPYKLYFDNVSEYIGLDFVNDGHSHESEQIDVFYDGKTIPFDDNSFDSILSSEVFEHVFELPIILQEINRVLKPGGHILFTCPFVWKEHEIPNDYARYTSFALTHLLKKNGFSIVTVDKSGDFTSTIFQLAILFVFDYIYPKVNRIPIAKSIFEITFFAIPNCFAIVLSKVFSKNQTIYLNNIIVARKC